MDAKMRGNGYDKRPYPVAFSRTSGALTSRARS